MEKIPWHRGIFPGRSEELASSRLQRSRYWYSFHRQVGLPLQLLIILGIGRQKRRSPADSARSECAAFARITAEHNLQTVFVFPYEEASKAYTLHPNIASKDGHFLK